MREKLFLIFVLIFVLSGFSTYAQDKIILGYVDFPPYEYSENNKPKGVLVEIVEKLFKRANIDLELKLLPFKRAMAETQNGAIDGLFNFYKNEERLKHFDYSDPVIKNRLVFFVRKDSTLEYRQLQDLKDLNVGVLRGYTYGKEFDESNLFFKKPVNSHLSNLKKLVLDRINVYPCDKLVGIYTAKKAGIMMELKTLSKPLKVMDGHIGFAKGKHELVLKKINRELKLMKQKGEIEKMIDEYVLAHISD